MRSRTSITATSLLAFLARSVFAQTATQTVTFQVDAINQISVAGAPTLAVTTATAGSAPTSVTSSGETWSVTTNQTGAKITGNLSSNMPSGLTLSVTLGAPAGAASAGQKSLSTVAVDLVTSITKLNASGLSLTYQLDAATTAGVVASTTRTVTFTITGGV